MPALRIPLSAPHPSAFQLVAVIAFLLHSTYNQQQIAGPEGPDYQYTTKLFYMVHIRPKGPVPVLALEWQISNEVPNNLAALKRAAERVTPEYVEVSSWEKDSGKDVNVGLTRLDVPQAS